MSDEKSSIEIGKDKIKIEAKEGVVERAGNQFLDLVSPLTEIAGAVGDTARIYRQKNAIRGLKMTHDLALELDVQLKPVSPKFLIDWVEKVSLEEEGSDDLSKLWAGLLLAESRKSSPSHLLFKRLLAEMSGLHREFLDELAGISQSTQFEYDNYLNMFDGIQNFSGAQQGLLEVNSIESKRKIANMLQRPGIMISDIALEDIDTALQTLTIKKALNQSLLEEKYGHSIVLQHLKVSQLVDTMVYHYETNEANDNKYLLVEYVLLTPTGISFLSSCFGGPQ